MFLFYLYFNRLQKLDIIQWYCIISTYSFSILILLTKFTNFGQSNTLKLRSNVFR